MRSSPFIVRHQVPTLELLDRTWHGPWQALLHDLVFNLGFCLPNVQPAYHGNDLDAVCQGSSLSPNNTVVRRCSYTVGSNVAATVPEHSKPKPGLW